MGAHSLYVHQLIHEFISKKYLTSSVTNFCFKIGTIQMNKSIIVVMSQTTLQVAGLSNYVD